MFDFHVRVCKNITSFFCVHISRDRLFCTTVNFQKAFFEKSFAHVHKNVTSLCVHAQTDELV